MNQKRVLTSLAVALAMIVFGLIGYMVIVLAGDYVIDDRKFVMSSATSLVDEEGELITKLFVENREIVPIHAVPDHVQQAFIAIEDARFYEHQGIDFRAIGRALYRDMLAGAKVEGASTITQQLAKNIFLSHEKTWLRKTKEVLIAMNLERQYSKSEILEMYVNQIYFGHGAYGIQAAAKLYFNKDVSELTIAEGALLAGLPKAPNHYSPITNKERSQKRRDLVLSVMHRRGFLSAEEVTRLQGRTVAVDPHTFSEDVAVLTYIDMVLDEAEEKYQLSNQEVLSGGYTIVVPLNRDLQQSSYELMQDGSYFPGTNDQVQSAFVLIDSSNGGVLAVQGGRDYVRKGINRVNVKRQPGSTFKPLAVFAPALETGEYQPYTLLQDEWVDYQGYRPRNYNHEYQGELTLYDAITHSVNAPAVWLLNRLGISTAKAYLQQLGFQLPDQGLSIALGGLSEGVTPLQMATAYLAFANDGKVVEPFFIKEIYDRDSQLIAKAKSEEKDIFSAQTAWFMTRMLESVVREGTARQGDFPYALAGKTGTTSFTDVRGGARDAWFVGYTPQVVGSLWMGYDMTSSDQYLVGGSSYATVLFKEILKRLPEEKQAYAFTKPNGITELESPIRLTAVEDLEASLTFGESSLLGVTLRWTTGDDNRVDYHIYESSEDGYNKIASVTGKGTFTVDGVNPFSLKDYIIIPYNPQTGQQGSPSNRTNVSIGF